MSYTRYLHPVTSSLTENLTHTHICIIYRQKSTLHHINVLFTNIHLNFPHVMESQMSRELLDKFLEDDIIALSGGELDDNLLGSDMEENFENHHPSTKPYSIIDELMDNPPTHHNKN